VSSWWDPGNSALWISRFISSSSLGTATGGGLDATLPLRADIEEEKKAKRELPVGDAALFGVVGSAAAAATLVLTWRVGVGCVELDSEGTSCTCPCFHTGTGSEDTRLVCFLSPVYDMLDRPIILFANSIDPRKLNVGDSRSSWS
jgi:hypothetical protein